MSEGMAQRIKRLRKERGLTLEQVANVVGVGKSTVRKWENGIIANMRRDKIADLAKALGTTPDYLMGWDNPVYECPDDENPWEVNMRDAFTKLDLDSQIYVSKWVEYYAENGNSPSEEVLTEGESEMLKLFRLVPEDHKQMVIQMIRAALSSLE